MSFFACYTLGMKQINWTDLTKDYKGLWVALTQDEKSVVASGKSAKKVYEDAKNMGVEVPLLFKVPTTSGLYIGQYR